MYDRYDRQVRLIGKDVQDKIESLKVSLVDFSSSFVGGEILKNLTLLGVRQFKINQTSLDSYQKLVLDNIKNLNKNIDLEIVEDLDDEYDIKIGIDLPQGCTIHQDTICICTGCYCFSTGHTPKGCSPKKGDVVQDCLLGAFVVQEVIKKVGDKEYLKEHSLLNIL